MGNKRIKIGPFLLMLASACGLYAQDFDQMVESLIDGSVQLIYPDSLENLLEKNENVLILDAREKEEFDVSHLKNAVWVGYKDFDFSRIKADKDREVVVYCSVGYRSEKIGEKLQDAGFKNVNNLYGGIFGWKNGGFDVVDASDSKTEKVHAYSKSWGKWLVKGEKVYE